MCLNTFCVDSNPTLNTVKLVFFEVPMYHENRDILPSIDSSGLYPDNNDSTEGITVFSVGITSGN